MSYRSDRHKSHNRALIHVLSLAFVMLVAYLALPLFAPVVYRGHMRNTARLTILRGQGEPVDTPSVVRRPPQTPYGVYIINVGEQSSVEPGMHIFTGDIYVGVVEQTTDQTSVVASMAYPGHETRAIHRPTRTEIMLKGKGGNTAIFEAPRDLEVGEGDVFTFPGDPDVVVAVVESIIFDERNPFQSVFVRAPFTPLMVQEVTIGRN